MPERDIDQLIALYAGGVRVPANLAPALARELANCAPSDLSADERESLDELGAVANGIDDTILARERRDGNVQGFRIAFTHAWSSAHSVLQGLALLPPDISERGGSAQKLLGEIFPSGVAFVTLRARAAWAAGRRTLRHVERMELRAALVELVGEDLVLAMERATDQLGEAIGTGSTAREIPETSDLASKARAFTRALARYCRLLAARVDDEDDDEVRRYLTAVAPIESYRVTRSRGGDEEEDEGEDLDVSTDPREDVVEPTPPIEPSPTA